MNSYYLQHAIFVILSFKSSEIIKWKRKMIRIFAALIKFDCFTIYNIHREVIILINYSQY